MTHAVCQRTVPVPVVGVLLLSFLLPRIKQTNAQKKAPLWFCTNLLCKHVILATVIPHRQHFAWMITGILVSVTCGLTVCSCAVFSAGRRQQINPLGQQAPPGAAVLPQVVHFNFPVVQNISSISFFKSVNPYEHAKVHPKCFFFLSSPS